MKKISSFAIISSLVLASTSAFAGGLSEPVAEEQPVVVTDSGSSSAFPLWAVVGGAVVVGALVASGDSSSTSNSNETAE